MPYEIWTRAGGYGIAALLMLVLPMWLFLALTAVGFVVFVWMEERDGNGWRTWPLTRYLRGRRSAVRVTPLPNPRHRAE